MARRLIFVIAALMLVVPASASAKRCWHRHDTAAAGHWQRAIFLTRIRSPHNVARWYVNGKQVARWKFHIVSEGD